MSESNKLHEEQPNVILSDEKELLLDHEYDGIQELNNPMPPWWLYGFYFTIALSVVYLLYYHIPGWGPSQFDEYEAEMAYAEQRYQPSADQPPAVNFAELAILSDEASIAAGKALYAAPRNLCTTCHGQNAEGLVGPNLTDDFWIHGCDLESIVYSIKNGYPSLGMIAYGSGAPLTDTELHQLSSYIISLRGTNPVNAKQPEPDRAVECTL
jgi:cytochrome c oxidase cbb3-type subunit 3